MLRSVEPELLDHLPADDPAAIESRRDLQRINWWMGHSQIMRRALRAACPEHPRRLTEIGGGDGTFLLSVAHQWPSPGAAVQATIVDRLPLLTNQTREAFQSVGWEAEMLPADVFDWLETPNSFADCIVANLFLHHFQTAALTQLLSMVSARTNTFVACEPRRSLFALTSTRLLSLIGCNSVTRHDARVSVRAGFTGTELSELWPSSGEWQLEEHPAGPFGHCFVAQRRSER